MPLGGEERKVLNFRGRRLGGVEAVVRLGFF